MSTRLDHLRALKEILLIRSIQCSQATQTVARHLNAYQVADRAHASMEVLLADVTRQCAAWAGAGHNLPTERVMGWAPWMIDMHSRLQGASAQVRVLEGEVARAADAARKAQCQRDSTDSMVKRAKSAHRKYMEACCASAVDDLWSRRASDR